MKRTLLCMALAGLGACSVGPDFQAPQADLPVSWQYTVQPGSTGAGEADSQWWQQLGDPQLTALVERAAHANLDVRTASNRLEQSRLMRQITGSEQLPGISANGAYKRARNSSVGILDESNEEGLAPFELWSSTVDASWEVDLWGHVRRSVEAAEAEVQLTQAQRDGVLLSISAETATDYLRLRGVQAKLAVARENLDIARHSYQLTKTRFDNGVTTNLDTANSAAQVATIEAVLPVLGAQQDRLINALSFLLGEAPRALHAELIEAKAIPNPAPDVPLGLPSELARRRPDIQQSEAALHRATAAIGVAKADFYPRISLGASIGFQALDGSNFGNWSSRQWSYGPSVYLPLFQGGRLTGTLELRKREQQQAAIDYRRVVLNAWHEVDDAMTDYSAEKQHHTALAEAVNQNTIALSTARDRYQQGAVDFINVLGVQRALLATQSDLVDSATQAALDRVQLYRALGGGWPTGTEPGFQPYYTQFVKQLKGKQQVWLSDGGTGQGLTVRHRAKPGKPGTSILAWPWPALQATGLPANTEPVAAPSTPGDRPSCPSANPHHSVHQPTAMRQATRLIRQRIRYRPLRCDAVSCARRFFAVPLASKARRLPIRSPC